MLLRTLLLSLLLTLAVRAFRRLFDGIAEGMRGDAPSGATGRARVPQRGVQMARDPVCGTFVVPDRAVSIRVGRDQVHFCSTACRDKFRAKTA